MAKLNDLFARRRANRKIINFIDLKSPIPYFGGKRWLAERIVALIPPHVTYVEPFAGGAQVLFRKLPSKVEVLNDLDGELINFYRVAQAHAEELSRYASHMVPSRSWFKQLLAADTAQLTDVQRAARYLYIQRLAFGAKVRGQSIALGIAAKPRFDPRAIPAILAQAADRLEHVQLENLPYTKLFERYDRPTTFFYIDPPFFSTRFYKHNFEVADFVTLARLLLNLQGKFIMSLNDVPEVRKLFQDFQIEGVPVRYTNRSLMKRNGREQDASELLIRNC